MSILWKSTIWTLFWGFPQDAQDLPKSGSCAISQKVAQKLLKMSKAFLTEVAQRLHQNKQQQKDCCSLPLSNLVQKYARCETKVRFLSIL